MCVCVCVCGCVYVSGSMIVRRVQFIFETSLEYRTLIIAGRPVGQSCVKDGCRRVEREF